VEPAKPLDGKVTNAATMAITTAVVAGTVVTAVEKVVTRYSISIAPNVSVQILRKRKSVQRTTNVVSSPIPATNVATMQTTTAVAIGTMVIAAGRAATNTNALIAKNASA